MLNKKNISFAKKVKNEIFYNKQIKMKNALAQSYGLISCGKYFSIDNISISTENKGVARLFCNFIYDLIPITGTITLTETRNNGFNTTYTATIDEYEDRKTILEKYGNTDNDKLNFDLLKSNTEIEAFLSGAYLACGNITDPLKSYQMEFVFNNYNQAINLSDLLFMLHIKHGIMKRREQEVIYIKESEQIENMLTLIGATKTVFDLMNVKIYKEIRNKANRQTNCETANIDKTVRAASKQMEAIELLYKNKLIDKLSDDLIELAELRMENPDMSLRELGENHSMNLSRSAVNHRLEKLITLAKINK